MVYQQIYNIDEHDLNSKGGLIDCGLFNRSIQYRDFRKQMYSEEAM